MVTAIVSEWSTNANANNSPPPIGAPEGMQPSYVNNVMRRIMAGVREMADAIDATFAGLGTMAAQNAGNVQITNGTASLSSFVVPGVFQATVAANGQPPYIAFGAAIRVDQGGTGAVTAAAALNNLGVNSYARMGDLWMAHQIVPRGVILLWWGRPRTDPVPYGFALCDGGVYTSPLNGDAIATPDFQDRFPVAAGRAYQLGNGGGDTIVGVTTNRAGNHSHFGATKGTALTVGQLPPHAHDVPRYWNSAGWGEYQNIHAVGGDGGIWFNNVTGSIGNGEVHAHGLDVDGEHEHFVQFDNRPPYLGVGFIMKL